MSIIVVIVGCAFDSVVSGGVEHFAESVGDRAIS